MEKVQYIEANGLRFAFLSAGQPGAPLVLMVHGFPDTAHSWDFVRPQVAELGFHVVAPFTRGYAPSAIPPTEDYGTDTLARDLLALAEVFGARRFILLGHDWGASAGYSAAGLAPERLRLLITVGLPHPASILPTPRMIWTVRHFFSLRRNGAAGWIRAGQLAHLDELVARWSPAWRVPPEETAAVKESLSQPGSLEAALGYYRALAPGIPPGQRCKVSCPTVAFAGSDDNVPLSAYVRARRRFAGSYEVIAMPGGHFMHREHPEIFARELLSLLGAMNHEPG